MTNMGNYFRQTYDSISEYMPAVPLFGGSDNEKPNKNSKLKQIRQRIKSTKLSTNKNDKSPKRVNAENKDKRWYDKFFFGSNDEEDVSTEIPTAVEPPQESGFFSWFSNDGEKEVPIVNTTHDKQQGDFPFYFHFLLMF